jgi:hypothetical protein
MEGSGCGLFAVRYFTKNFKVCDYVRAGKDSEEVEVCVGFEVFTTVTMKNGVFWDVTPCDSCKNRRFGGT